MLPPVCAADSAARTPTALAPPLPPAPPPAGRPSAAQVEEIIALQHSIHACAAPEDGAPLWRAEDGRVQQGRMYKAELKRSHEATREKTSRRAFARARAIDGDAVTR